MKSIISVIIIIAVSSILKSQSISDNSYINQDIIPSYYPYISNDNGQNIWNCWAIAIMGAA